MKFLTSAGTVRVPIEGQFPEESRVALGGGRGPRWRDSPAAAAGRGPTLCHLVPRPSSVEAAGSPGGPRDAGVASRHRRGG